MRVIMRKRRQSPHPAAIAKMIMMVIMRTIMLSMKRSRGTITKPNQARMIRSIKPIRKDETPIKKNGIRTTIKATIAPKVVIPEMIMLIINPIIGHTVKISPIRKLKSNKLRIAT